MALVPFPSQAAERVPDDDVDPDRGPDQEPDDFDGGKMSFLEHLDELRKRIIRSVIAIFVGFLIACFFIEGGLWISGLPGRRDWLANVLADPRLTLHLKGATRADLPARARVVTDEPTRRAILTRITRAWGRGAQLERFVAEAPLIEVTLADPTILDG